MSAKRSLGTETPGIVRKRPNDCTKFGDDHAGFEAILERPQRLVRLRLWGQWNMAICEEFCNTVLRFADDLRPRKWSILTDSRHFAAQAPNVAQLRQQTMARLSALGCVKIAAVVQQVVYAMQFRRITEESHVQSKVFYDEKTAMAWLSEEEPHPR